ncbi:hypothetical protein [Stappia sp.]|uniref:hypothetical protein n=1 Tax=Stappia sp. TaxID=1870903 RepID=UPI0032D8EA59
MSTARSETPPQSAALVWLTLTHVFVLPLAGAFLPNLFLGLGGTLGLDAQGAMLALAGLLAVAIVVLHLGIWRIARREGHRPMATLALLLGGVSLVTLYLFATPSPLVAGVRYVMVLV